MATWTQTFSVNNKYSLTLECTEQSYSVPNNTSVVAWKLTMATAAYSYTGYADYKTTISISINDTQVYSYSAARNFNASAAASYIEVLKSGTTTVAHDDATGAKTCACAASVSVASGPYSPGSASISQSLTLTTIPRASSASWSGDFTIGVDKAINITAASTALRHEFTFTVGSASASAFVAAGTNSYTWRPASNTFAAQFPTQTSRTGTMVLKTYNGSALVGSVSYTFTLKIPDSWKPTEPTISLSPVNEGWLQNKGIYVAGYTKTRVQATSSASAGTTISSWTVSGAASMTQSGSSLDKTSGVIASSGSKSFTVTVTDARGRTASKSATASYVAYSTPAVTSLTVTRGTYSGGTWTQSDSGSDLQAVFKAACSLSGEGNVMAWEIGAPFNVRGSALANNGTITRYAVGAGTATAYTPVVTVTDELGNSGSKSVQVPTVEMPFVINVTKPAVGVGGVPQTARTLELASNWTMAPGGGVAMPYTNDILTDALTVAAGACKAFRGSGGSYTGTFPWTTAIYSYGTFIVTRRNANYISVLAIPYSPNYGTAINATNDGGSTWYGWRRDAPVGASWTPAFSYSDGSTAPTVSNISCYYYNFMGMLWMSGQFNITNLQAAGNKQFRFTPPVSLATSSCAGTLFLPASAGTLVAPLLLYAQGANVIQAINGGGGQYSRPVMTTGYYRFTVQAVAA